MCDLHVLILSKGIETQNMNTKSKLSIKKVVPKVDSSNNKIKPSTTKIKEEGGLDKGFIVRWF